MIIVSMWDIRAVLVFFNEVKLNHLGGVVAMKLKLEIGMIYSS